MSFVKKETLGLPLRGRDWFDHTERHAFHFRKEKIPMAQKIHSDKPAHSGAKNALLRAEQLLKLRWTPAGAYPVVYPAGAIGGPTLKGFFKAHRPQFGVGYSAVGYTNEKYVGVNVSLDTYMTAMANPRSVLYTRPQYERGRLSAAFYGTVCSAFASFVMGFPFHIDCGQFSEMEEMEHIDASKLENLQLCDLLNEPKTHTAVITGIDRDEAGKVVSITVTESTLPQVTRTTFLPEEFIGYWLNNGYEVLRYKRLHTVTYTPSPWVHLEEDPDAETPVPNPVLMPDYGDKANYRLGESVTLSVFDPGYTEILLQYDGEEKTLSVSEDGDVTFCPDKPGYYSVVAVSAAGNSEPVEFCVTDASVVTDKAEYPAGEALRVAFSCSADDELMGWMVKRAATSSKYWGFLRSEDGSLADSALLPPGDYFIIAHYRNRFGVYSATTSPVFHVAE